MPPVEPEVKKKAEGGGQRDARAGGLTFVPFISPIAQATVASLGGGFSSKNRVHCRMTG
jgi:hypothetical protein